MIKYSLILPVYNVELYLEKCINSLLKQTVSDYELILIDDGSTDNCPNICDKYKSQESRIKVIHQNNGGVSKARNTGIENAKGTYILFIDPDDYVLDNYLETINDNINNYDMLIFSYNKLYKNKIVKGFGENNVISSHSAQRYLVEDDKICGYVWNKVFKRDIIDKYHLRFNSSVSMCEDVLFTFQYLYYSNSIKLIDDILINYRQRKSSAMAKKIQNIEPNSLVKTYDFIIKNTGDEFVKIKSEALYLKSFYKFRKYTKDKQFNMELIKDIKKQDYTKMSKHDKKIIFMYRYIPMLRTIIYKLKDYIYVKFD